MRNQIPATRFPWAIQCSPGESVREAALSPTTDRVSLIRPRLDKASVIPANAN
jgi:hypothetical protein